MKIVQYETIKSNNSKQFDTHICNLIKEGWEPYGNPYMSSSCSYIQAMVKRQKINPDDIPDEQGISVNMIKHGY